MNAFVKFFAGLAAVAALGMFSIERDTLPGSRAAAEARLDQAAEQALADAGADWARADMDGQKAVLSGAAPNPAALEAAAAALQGAAWRGGPIFGGVTAVDVSGAAVDAGSPLIDPFAWIAEYEKGTLVFSGYVPSQAARVAVYELAAMRFPGVEISGELEIARGAPPENDWLAAVSISLQALAQLQSGAAEARGERFIVSGRVADADGASAVRMLMATLPAGLAGAADISAPAAPPPPEAPVAVALEPDPAPAETAATAEEDSADETEAAPAATEVSDLSAGEAAAETDAEGEEPAETAFAAECRSRLAAIIDGFQLSFASTSAAIDPANEDRLRELATVLLVCPQFALEITGHTDSSGDEARNARLSRERAEAVAAALHAFGVAQTRLTADGAGSNEPIADNATRAGREQNRRIEFALTKTIGE